VRRLEDAGVVGEHAEQQPHQQHFQIVPLVAECLELVMQLAHAFGRTHVDRVLGPDFLGLITGDEAEQPDMLRQLGGQDLGFAVLFQIVEPDTLEIADHDVAWQFAILQAIEIVECLEMRLAQRLAARLVLGNHHPGPEAIDIAAGPIKLLDPLLERVDPRTVHTEHAEELVPETLRLAALVAGVFPVAGKASGAITDFIPGDRHGRGLQVLRMNAAFSARSKVRIWRIPRRWQQAR